MTLDIGTARAVALAFAEAITHYDYGRAAQLITPDCVYEVHGRRVAGAPQVMAEYRKSAIMTQRICGAVAHAAAVIEVDSGQATIAFDDSFTHGAHTHTFKCQQHLTFGRDGRIRRITHIDLKDEPERLAQFLHSAGLG